MALVRLLFSYYLLAQRNTLTANIHSIRANGQVKHLPLFFTTERAAKPSLLLLFFSSCAYCSDTFVTDIDTSGSGNETLDLVLLFAAKGTNIGLSPTFSHNAVRFSRLSLSGLHIEDARKQKVSPTPLFRLLIKHLDGFRSYLLQTETKAFQHICAYPVSFTYQP